MSRRFRYPGPMGSRSYSHLQPDLYFRSGIDAQYSVPSTELLRMTAPSGVEMEFLITQAESALPGWDRLPDKDAAEMCKQLDEIKREQTGRPLNGTHVFYHVTLGSQVTSHHPYRIKSASDPRSSVEVDAVLAADINLQFHDDDEAGWEFTAALQGSRNFIVLDPNRNNPDFSSFTPEDIKRSERATQAQLQLQIAYAFKAIETDKFKFSFSALFQLVGGANFQYDPSMKKVALTWGKGVAAGFGLDIEHSSISNVKLTLQGTAGTSASGDRIRDFVGPTVDPSLSVGVKIEFKGL